MPPPRAFALSPLEQRVLAAVDEAALVRDLGDLVAIPSLDGEETAAQERGAELMAAYGLAVDRWWIDLDGLRRHPSYSCEVERREALGVVGVAGETRGGRDIIFNAHIDVVPPGDATRWTHGPWCGGVHGGCVYGRGALDDKGGVVCSIHAARALTVAGARLKGRVLVESVVGEEDGGTGTLGAILRGHTADGAVVVEPTELMIIPAQAGALNFRVTVQGRSAHGCVRDQGVSAFEKFLPLHEALLELERVRNERARAQDEAAARPLYEAYRLLIPLSVGTVEAGDWPSSVPERLVCQGRYGIGVGEALSEARVEFEDAVARAAAADPWLREHPPVVEWWGGQFASAQTSLDAPVVEALAWAAEHLTGAAPRVEGATYGADMRLLVNDGCIPSVLFGPGDVRLAHGPDERVPVRELAQAARILALTALRFCGHND